MVALSTASAAPVVTIATENTDSIIATTSSKLISLRVLSIRFSS
jgi:hypothetical protein